jgi:hypothetical protein
MAEQLVPSFCFKGCIGSYNTVNHSINPKIKNIVIRLVWCLSQVIIANDIE